MRTYSNGIHSLYICTMIQDTHKRCKQQAIKEYSIGALIGILMATLLHTAIYYGII